MIISKTHGVVYVAVPKTASQALSSLFEQKLKGSDEGVRAEEQLNDWHASLDEAKEISELPLENFWSFAFVRNPFDRFISYCAGHVPNFDIDPGNVLRQTVFEARNGENRWLLPQMYFLNGVRRVYRYEYMNEAVADIAKRLDLDLGAVPRVNVSDREGYAGYYDDELKQAVAEVYAGDLLNLDYRF